MGCLALGSSRPATGAVGAQAGKLLYVMCQSGFRHHRIPGYLNATWLTRDESPALLDTLAPHSVSSVGVEAIV